MVNSNSISAQIRLASETEHQKLSHAVVHLERPSADVAPVLFPNILVNLNGGAVTIQRVTTGSLWPRNPVALSSIEVVIVGLETRPLEALESAALVVERAPGL